MDRCAKDPVAFDVPAAGCGDLGWCATPRSKEPLSSSDIRTPSSCSSMRTVNKRVNASDFLGPLSPVEKANAPKRLYVSGDRSIMKAGLRVAVVGTRKPTEAGRQRAHKLATLLAQRGVVVVSGLAKGVDTIAHKAAISAGGRTMAVIGTPLSKAYPAENRELQNRIAEEHLLVSEFEEGAAGGRWTFPKRNRTMALLSDATVIIEAGLKSGTENQGWEAIRLGRPLLLLQSLLNAGHPWLKRLIEYGAIPLSDENFEDVMAELPPTSSREADDAAF